ncbi:hypothetical protein CDD82_2837 [Ophiocordyceps australis]|uniref:Uncharacterized protein n=1 Tax=Ophiocordyceps australis TaxID=1399860 RepID=A0A2C5ZG98_9HYPO|nr:hypothetical protein CDD82_2837 [Ophiocordyceps australis]
MSTPLSPQELESFTVIIDDILAAADLETISRKKIRQGLERELGGRDLSQQKEAIKNLIEARFDAASGVDTGAVSAPAVSTEIVSTNKLKRSASHGNSEDGETDPSASPEPARKKVKRSTSVEDSDARLAAQLQAQENSLARSRVTRGGSTSKKRKVPRKKSSKKVGGDDDSSVDASADSAPPPKRRAGGGFQKPFILSETLSELCGETQLSRPQVVKKLWEHIKSNNLQDPNDRRSIRCDEKMHAVFKQAKVDMFRMNKDIGNHLYPVEE